MKVSKQCGIAASKDNQILGLIRRTITYKNKQLIVALYKAIVRLHLERHKINKKDYSDEQLKLFQRPQL